VQERKFPTKAALATLFLLSPLAGVIYNYVPESSAAAFTPSATTYGGPRPDLANEIEQTSDGGYIVAGFTESFGAGGLDVWVARFDANGNVIWERSYGGSGLDNSFSVRQTSDGGFIVAGVTQSFGAGIQDAWVLRLDPDGNVLWQRMLGGSGDDGAVEVQQTSDGGYIVAGHTLSFGAGALDTWIIKLDTTGNVIWQKASGGSLFDRAFSVRQTFDGGYIVAGYADSQTGGGISGDASVLRLDALGNVIWHRTYGGDNGDAANSVRQTSDGGFIVAGFTISFGAGGFFGDTWVLRLDPDGNVVWQKSYGRPGSDNGFQIAQTLDGGFVVAGFTESFGAGSADAWVLRLDPSGNVVWQNTYGGPLEDLAISAQPTTDGGVLVAGSTESFGAGASDAWILRLDANGFIAGCNPVRPSAALVTDTAARTTTKITQGIDTPARPTTTQASLSPTFVTVSIQCGRETISVEIDIKPGSDPNSIYPGSMGTVPVAILSSTHFDAPSQVDTSTLTFGRTGDENSLAFCSPSPEDVNGDGLLDLVCHFNTGMTGFQPGDTQGVLKGHLVDDTLIEGRDSLRIVAGGGGRASSV